MGWNESSGADWLEVLGEVRVAYMFLVEWDKGSGADRLEVLCGVSGMRCESDAGWFGSVETD